MQHPLPITRIKGFHSYPYPHLKTTYMDVLVKFSLLHINMEVTLENKSIVSIGFVSTKFSYINWLEDIIDISSPPSLN
jgi:hypothetical protein